MVDAHAVPAQLKLTISSRAPQSTLLSRLSMTSAANSWRTACHTVKNAQRPMQWRLMYCVWRLTDVHLTFASWHGVIRVTKPLHVLAHRMFAGSTALSHKL